MQIERLVEKLEEAGCTVLLVEDTPSGTCIRLDQKHAVRTSGLDFYAVRYDSRTSNTRSCLSRSCSKLVEDLDKLGYFRKRSMTEQDMVAMLVRLYNEKDGLPFYTGAIGTFMDLAIAAEETAADELISLLASKLQQVYNPNDAKPSDKIAWELNRIIDTTKHIRDQLVPAISCQE